MNLNRCAALIAAALTIAGAAGAKPLKVENLDIATARGVYHFKVEVADNDATRERGLMFRKVPLRRTGACCSTSSTPCRWRSG